MGGARAGAGRPKGVPNRATAAKAAEIAASGLTPLDYMLGILRDESRHDAERFEAAKQAAPYCHPKLAATTVDLGAETIDVLAEIIAQRRQRVAEADNGD
jgi:hypothetical protein